MPYTITLPPNNYTAAYSAVPVQVYSTEYNDYEQYKYLINLCWNVSNALAGSSALNYTINNSVYTQFTLANHGFQVGDKVLLYNATTTSINGYYNILRVLSSSQFVIDLEPSINISSYTFKIGNVIKYKIDPDLNGYGNVDLQNTLKDFVTQNLSANTTNYGLSYNGSDTMFQYDIYGGEEKVFELPFTSNFNSGGTVGFYSTGITATTGTIFQVGDVISIQQDMVAWNYTDNFFIAGGLVGFTGTTAHSFLSGQTINVTGQDTYPYYNGDTTITSATTYSVLTSKSWQGSSPVDGGVIYGVPRPSYNTTGTITQIFVDPTSGLCIVTDIVFTTNSVPISGSIKYADGRLTETPIKDTVTGKRTYNAHINREDYSTSFFSDYVLTGSGLQNISTILNTNEEYRIERSSIGFLLTHTAVNSSWIDGMAYVFRNSSNTVIGEVVISKPASSTDFYSPIGLQQIGDSTKTIISGGAFSGYSGSVDNYSVFAVDLVGIVYTQRSQMIDFKLNDDCSMYEVYHLMWKDRYGSFITYPFIYISRDTTEVAKSSYYQTEGNFTPSSFGYSQWDRGTKDFYSKSKDIITVNSGWLYEFERDLIKDLLQSPSIYLQSPQNDLYPVQLAENKLEIYKKINEDLYQYTLNLIVSYNEIRY